MEITNFRTSSLKLATQYFTSIESPPKEDFFNNTFDEILLQQFDFLEIKVEEKCTKKS